MIREAMVTGAERQMCLGGRDICVSLKIHFVNEL